MVLERKEIENYLLVPDVLQRALERTIADAARRGQKPGKPIDVQATLLGIVDPFKAELQGVYLGKRWEHLRSCGRSIDTVNKETLEWFEDNWSNPSSRLKIVAGKTALAALRDQVKQHCRVSLTDARIFDAFRRDDVPPDLANLINALEAFRTASTTNAG